MYRALYRKWRPQRFEDVVGQRAIVTALKNQITAGRVGHAYLFTGVRGTGKTTCAKIFAKAVNCLHPEGGDPCGKCEICKGIDNGSLLDVVEMDAASNNGVDDIRDLRDETAYTPSACKYKVYIIDEVHMLSTAAFNALLKTLEEPPAHVIFILATTEIQKVPATILSRCQRYDFTRIGPEDIARRVEYIAGEEKLELTSDGPLVSANLNGSGMLAVTTQISGTKGHVDVYGADMQVLFAFNAHRRFVADACVTEDGGYLAAVTMGQADSVFISDLVIYDLTQEDPVADYSVPDGLVTAMTGRGDRILTVTDTCLAVGNTAGKLVGTYSYNGEYLREYDLGGEDYTVLQLNRYQSGSVGRLVTVDDDGEEIASLDVAEEVRDVSACGRYLSVLYADRLVVYNRQLQAYATLHGPEHTREVLTRADGSVLMIGADSAELFLP